MIGRTPWGGIPVESMKDLNEFRKADRVLADIMRKVHVLEEHISGTAGALATPMR